MKISLLPKTLPTTKKQAYIAIIIPFRDREEHLQLFLNHFRYLQIQNNNYVDIYVIVQNDALKFNRGLLLNVGYLLSKRNRKYNRYIFHDVDSYPTQLLFNQYFLFTPKNIHFASPHLGYKYSYNNFIGGVIGMSGADFEKIDGFPNNFFGWGGEDDILYDRIKNKGVVVVRPAVGNYILVDHEGPTDEQYNFLKKDNKKYELANSAKNGIAALKKKELSYKQVSISDIIPFSKTCNIDATALDKGECLTEHILIFVYKAMLDSLE